MARLQLIQVIAGLWLVCCSTAVQGLQPSRGTRRESIAEYRQRNGIVFNYHPEHIHPEFCRTLSEEECRELDEQEAEAAKRNRRFLTKEGREHVRRSLYDHPFRNDLDSSGTLNVLVCLMVWSDHQDRDLPAREDIDAMFNGVGIDDSLYPTGSVNTWMETNSYGAFSITATVVEWVVTDNTELFYSNPNSGRTTALEDAFAPVLDALDDEGFDFSPFDSDGDFQLDLTVFLHSGYDGSNGGDDCNTGATSSERIAAHARAASSGSWRASSGYALGGYSVASAYQGVCNFNMARIGVISHEMLHPFGLPDIYDIEGTDSGNLGGVGSFAIMGNPGGPSNRQAYPGIACAWTKWFLGWLELTEITTDGTYQATALAENAQAFSISTGFAVNEFLLIENRQPISGEFEEYFFATGLVIYHIDENVLVSDCGFGNCPHGGPYQSGWPENGNHYPVAILQSDGNYDLEQGTNNGDAGDVWVAGSNALGPGTGGVYPNTDSYVGGTIVETGITISNFREVSGSDPVIMEFDVSGLSEASTDPPTVAPANEPTASPTSSPVAVPTPSPTPGTVPSTPVATPTNPPTTSPTTSPTGAPTSSPTASPSASPTPLPTNSPTTEPSATPSSLPTPRPSPRPSLPYPISRPGLSHNFPSTPTNPPIPTQSPTSGKGKGGSSSLSHKAPVSSNVGTASIDSSGEIFVEGPPTTQKNKLSMFSDVKLKEIAGLSDASRRHRNRGRLY